jgi:hypothetical protein
LTILISSAESSGPIVQRRSLFYMLFTCGLPAEIGTHGSRDRIPPGYRVVIFL